MMYSLPLLVMMIASLQSLYCQGIFRNDIVDMDDEDKHIQELNTRLNYIKVYTSDDVQHEKVSRQTQMSRKKRSVRMGTQWVDKVVPYVFDPDLSDARKIRYRNFMDEIQNNTCIRFWDKGTNSTPHSATPYGDLNTKSWAYVYNDRQKCFSTIGGRLPGEISPCWGRFSFIHEFGHLLGKLHEMKLTTRTEFINLLLGNVGPWYRVQYDEFSEEKMQTIISCGFCLQSIMMYTRYSVSRYGWTTFLPLYDDLGKPTTKSMFLYYKEINIIQQCCGETTCSSSVCHNDGYLGMFQGKCQCMCPPGFDPQTKCATMITPNGCGHFHELTSSNREVSISSPNYPLPYGTLVTCNWGFKAAEGSQILMTFGDVDIGCNASLELGRYMFGDPPIPISKTGKVKPFLSIYNMAFVKFTSANTTCRKNGFRMTATLIPESSLPYDLASKGESYRGKMNYALGFEKCLPWHLGYEGHDNIYDMRLGNYEVCDNEADYCRNCGQRRLKPYCITAAMGGNVTYKYCDLTQSVPAYDLDNCGPSLIHDPDCVDSETRRVCFKTCRQLGKIQDYPSKDKPASQVSCSEPSVPSTVTKVTNRRAPYHVGETIVLRCNNGFLERRIMCRSDGTWSKLKNICTGCPLGFLQAGHNCYKWIRPTTSDKFYSECMAIFPGSTFPVWIETLDEFENVIIAMRDNNTEISGSSKVWTGLQYYYNNWVWHQSHRNIVRFPYAAKVWKNGNKYGIPVSRGDVAWILPNRTTPDGNKLSKPYHRGREAWGLCKLAYTSINATDVCGDVKDNCEENLALNPEFVHDYPEYARIYCPKTAGLCNTTSCSIPKPGSVGVSVDRTKLTTGQFATYSCMSGLARVSGNVLRACLSNGSLTGQELVCQESSRVPLSLNSLQMMDSESTTESNKIYAGPSPFYTAARSATLHSCRAFCRGHGPVHIQFWRRDPVYRREFTLIGDNTVTCIGGRAVTWTFLPHQRFRVQKGDFLGLLDTQGGTLAMHDCSGTALLSASDVMRTYDVSGQPPSPGKALQFSSSVKCYTYMINCHLE